MDHHWFPLFVPPRCLQDHPKAVKVIRHGAEKLIASNVTEVGCCGLEMAPVVDGMGDVDGWAAEMP